MAVNQSRDLRTELFEGLTENSYIRLAPNRGGVVEDTNPERMGWPTYQRAESHISVNPAHLSPGQAAEVHTAGTETTGRRTHRR